MPTSNSKFANKLVGRTEEEIRRILADNLIRLAEKNNGITPGKKEIDDDGAFSSRLYMRHGGLQLIQQIANLKPNPIGWNGHRELRSRNRTDEPPRAA